MEKRRKVRLGASRRAGRSRSRRDTSWAISGKSFPQRLRHLAPKTSAEVSRSVLKLISITLLVTYVACQNLVKVLGGGPVWQ
jgi:hypothetical protein